MNEQNSMVIFQQAAVMLARAVTIQAAKELKDLAIVAGEWAKRKNLGDEAVKYARDYALEAERRMGEILKQTERAKGAAGIGPVIAVTPCNHNNPPTLAKLGITKRESSEAQQLAEVSQEKFEDIKSGKITLRDIKSENKRESHIAAVAESKLNPVVSSGPYDLIFADPPWKYDFTETEARAIENQYATATLDDIKSHKPDGKYNSILLLWATAPKLIEALQVMEAWGYTYKTSAVWDKVLIGMGYWFRGQHELLLVGVKGNMSPPPDIARVSSVFTEQRTGHSKKPNCVYEWIEQAFPGLSKIEMYAREQRQGWSVWGAEAK